MPYTTPRLSFILLGLALSLCVACSNKSTPAPTNEAPKDSAKASNADKPNPAKGGPASSPASAPGKGPASSAASQPAKTSTAKVMTATTQGGLYKVTLKPAQTPVPFNSIFHIDTTVVDAKTSKPVEGAKVSVDATMPAHRHGMVTQPIHKEVGKGVYRSEGMKLHMPGDWVFQVDVEAPAGKDSAKIAHKQGSAAP